MREKGHTENTALWNSLFLFARGREIIPNSDLKETSKQEVLDKTTHMSSVPQSMQLS